MISTKIGFGLYTDITFSKQDKFR